MAPLPPIDARAAVLIAAPIASFVTIIALCIKAPLRKKPTVDSEQPRRALARRIAINGIISLFVAEGVLVGVTTSAQDATWPIIYVTGEVVWWTLIMYIHELYSDLTLWFAALTTAAFGVPLLVMRPLPALADGRPGFEFEIARLCVEAVRLGVLLCLVVDASFGLARARSQPAAADVEAEPLLQPSRTMVVNGSTSTATSRLADETGSTYGAMSSSPTTAQADAATAAMDAAKGEDKQENNKGDDADEDEDKGDPSTERMKKRREDRLKETGGWLAYLRDFDVLVRILDPRQEPHVILCMIGAGLCLAASRVLVVLVPRQLGIVVDTLMAGHAPYRELFVYLVLALIGSRSGIDMVQELLLLPVTMFGKRQLANAAFRQVMSLGMDFHSDRDTAEIIRAIQQGSSVTIALNHFVTLMLPSIFDVAIAMVILQRKFNIYLPVIMICAAAAFTALEIWTIKNNRKNQRSFAKLDREASRNMHQAVENWPTVAYFNKFDFESDRYAVSIRNKQAASKDYCIRDSLHDALKQGIVPLTFFLVASACVHEIAAGRGTAGDFVYLIQYWDYIIYPLRALSWQARWLFGDLIDAERMLELFMTKPSVVDRPNARTLPQIAGHVRFTDVDFAYDPRKPALTGLNIEAKPGQTIAFVGATGAGKSSIIKLLHRFYDVTAGSITIDGHDIRNVTISSLRESLGVVPQDVKLFNATISENLRYAKLEATDEELEAACRAAAVHDKIMALPDKYETKVGENGIKLSGGEAQRIAIARVFLKDPRILILDEATSAVDTATEAMIQAALEELQKERTTFIIAHRLSTIVDADIIVVVDDGKILESGDHEELLKREGGKYRSLWELQAKGAKSKKSKNGEQPMVTVEDLIELDKKVQNSDDDVNDETSKSKDAGDNN